MVHSEGGDVLDDSNGASDFNNSLVDTHLVSVPGVGTLTARRFSGGNSQDFGGDSSGALGLITLILSLGSSNEFSASLLKRLNFTALKCKSIQSECGFFEINNLPDSHVLLRGLTSLGLFLIVHIYVCKNSSSLILIIINFNEAYLIENTHL